MKKISVLFSALLLSLSANAQVKTPQPPPVKVPFAESLQAVVVTTEGPTAVQGSARMYERGTTKSKWKSVGDEFPVVVGRNGLAWVADFGPQEVQVEAPTFGPIYAALCSAWEKKDEAGLSKFYSRDTVKSFRESMREEGIKTLVDYLDDGTLKGCKAANERISGDFATAELISGTYPKGFTALFIREDGSWKLSHLDPFKYFPGKKEGDGRAPAGLFPLTFAFGRPEKPGEVKLSYSKLEQYSECVDDTASTHYNKLVDRLKVGIFDWKSSEKMLEVGPEYDLGLFVAHNSYPVRRGDGSCIFLHVWKDSTTGTSGCTAMERDNLLKVLNWADPKKNPYLVQLTEADLRKYQKAWNLPKP